MISTPQKSMHHMAQKPMNSTSQKPVNPTPYITKIYEP